MSQIGHWLHDSIEVYSQKTPHQVFLKIEDETQKINYSELNAYSKKLNLLFEEMHLQSDDVTLIALKRGVPQALIVALYLILGKKGLTFSNEFRSEEIARSCQIYPFNYIVVEKGSYLLDFFCEDYEVSGELEIPQLDNFTFVFMRKRLAICLRNNFFWLLMTSGSTGDPKAVMLSKKNLQQRTAGEIRLFRIQPRSQILNILSLSHDLGLNQLLTALQTGSSLEIFSKKFPLDLTERIHRGGFNGVTGIPNIWRSLILLCKKSAITFQNHFYLTISGGSLTPDELLSMREIFQNAVIYRTYGQTETFRSLCETDIHRNNLKSTGHPIQGVEVYLTEDGQLIHSGECCFSGYWLDDELSHSKIKPLNQFINSSSTQLAIATGDYFERSEDGSYRYLGRKDDLVKFAGYRFHLGEIENCLLQIPGVKNTFVTIHKASINREEIVAFIEAENQNILSSAYIRNFCIATLQTYKVPTKYVIVDKFPLTDTGKTHRKKLFSSHLESHHE